MTIQITIGADSPKEYADAEASLRTAQISLDVKHTTRNAWRHTPAMWERGSALYLDAQWAGGVPPLPQPAASPRVWVCGDDKSPQAAWFEYESRTQCVWQPLLHQTVVTPTAVCEPQTMVELPNAESLSWCFSHRHELLSTDNDAVQVSTDSMVRRGFVMRPEDVRISATDTLAAKLIPNTRTEFRVSDFSIPKSYSTPYELFTGRSWNVVVWGVNPYERNIKHSAWTTTVIERLYAEKDQPYMPRCYGYDMVEIGWVAYDVVDGSIFIHHIQLPGHLKGVLTNREERWMYKAMLMGFCQSQINKSVYVIDALTYDQASRSAVGEGTPMLQFSKHVLAGCNFSKVGWKSITPTHPTIAHNCTLLDHIHPHAIHFWKQAHAHHSVV